MGNQNSREQDRKVKAVSSVDKIKDDINKSEYILVIVECEVEELLKSRDTTKMETLAEEITAHNLQLRLINPDVLDKTEKLRLQGTIYNFETLLAKLNSARMDNALLQPLKEDLTGFDDLNSFRELYERLQRDIKILDDIANNENVCMSRYPSVHELLHLFQNTEELNAVKKEFSNLTKKFNAELTDNKFISLVKISRRLYKKVERLSISNDRKSVDERTTLLLNLEKTINKLNQCATEFEYLQKFEESLDSLIKMYDMDNDSKNFVQQQVSIIKINVEERHFESCLNLKKTNLLKTINEILEKNNNEPVNTEVPEDIYVNCTGILENYQTNIDSLNTNPKSSIGSVNKHDIELTKTKSIIHNRKPIPAPRDPNNILINQLPFYWERLNVLLNQTQLSDDERTEISNIKEQYDVAKELFENRFKQFNCRH